jgi:hypothetical protein
MRARLGLIAVATAILAVGSVTLASASSDRGHKEVIKLFALTVSSADLDLGDKGPSVGDRFVFADDVYDEKGGEKVGTDGGECVLVRVDLAAQTASNQCVVTLSLEDRGQITVQGLIELSLTDTRPTFTLPVTGGSGDFTGAGGEAEVEELSDTEANLTVTLD